MAALADLFEDYELPTFPQVVSEALAKLSDPEVAVSEVARTLESDPGISVRLLSIVNTAATGLRSRVDSVSQAATMLGRNQIESILISSAAKAAIPPTSSPVFDADRFWRAAASRAVLATTISEVTHPKRRSEAFTAALLQDMAVPVLVDQVPGYDKLLLRWHDGEIADLASAEEETFGWNHGSAAARMGEVWGFPQSLADAIASHHQKTSDSDADELIGVRLVSAWHEIDIEASRAEFIERAQLAPSLADRDCERLIDEAMSQVSDIQALFS